VKMLPIKYPMGYGFGNLASTPVGISDAGSNIPQWVFKIGDCGNAEH
jgi:hypothetical protein